MKRFRYDKTTGRMYQLYFINHDGIYLVMQSWSKQLITRMGWRLRKVQNNLILK